MARRSKRREWTKYDVRELKSLARQKTPVAKIAKLLKRTLRANAAESVLAWRIIGFARLEGPLPFHPMTYDAARRNRSAVLFSLGIAASPASKFITASCVAVTPGGH
jgi:hypothetical protein